MPGRKILCRTSYSKLIREKPYTCPKSCKFYHPGQVKEKYTKEYSRELGKCYCGSDLKTIVGVKADELVFFRVCSNTGRGMKNCK